MQFVDRSSSALRKQNRGNRPGSFDQEVRRCFRACDSFRASANLPPRPRMSETTLRQMSDNAEEIFQMLLHRFSATMKCMEQNNVTLEIARNIFELSRTHSDIVENMIFSGNLDNPRSGRYQGRFQQGQRCQQKQQPQQQQQRVQQYNSRFGGMPSSRASQQGLGQFDELEHYSQQQASQTGFFRPGYQQTHPNQARRQRGPSQTSLSGRYQRQNGQYPSNTRMGYVDSFDNELDNSGGLPHGPSGFPQQTDFEDY